MNIFGLLAICLFVATPIHGLYVPSDGVIELTASNFDRLVMEDDAIWVIEFYAPWCGHCQSFAPEFVKLAKATKGIIKVGSVDGDEYKALLAQFNVRGFPTIKIFGLNKNSPQDYSGERTAKAIAEAALAEARRKIKAVFGGASSSGSTPKGNKDDVIELTDDNFEKLVLNSEEPWLVEFYAPWCGHCKSLAPEWARAATELKGIVKMGALDATVYKSRASEYDVRGYPTIKYFPAGRKTLADVIEFNGGRTAPEIVRWAMDKHEATMPAPKAVEVTSDADFNAACDNKPLCVVAVLPHILDCDAKCRNAFIDVLNVNADRFKLKQWGWVWSEGGSQPKLEESLEIGGFGYPAMAVVNFKKMKFSVLKGAFSDEGINEFLRDISYGRGHTAPVRGAKKPQIATIEPWDGKDGQLPIEEDVDLSDIDLEETKDEL